VVRSVAVLGAGTMGAQIAAQFANAGVTTVLLDVSRDAARQGLERAMRLRPDPLFTPDRVSLIRTGGFDEDLEGVAGADWIIEAIVEQLEPKRALLGRLERVVRTRAIVSSNTSGLPIADLARDRSDDFRRRFLGTHFFNPPRYLPLLEIVPTDETDVEAVEIVSRFADHRLGKGVVIAKDTPNFIGNRIALYGVLLAIRAVESGRYTIDEVDAVTGVPLGRPKSATFRTLDIAGLDVLAHVATNLYARLPDGARAAFRLPPLIDALVDRGWVGEKAGRGFYMREPRASGETEILTLDPATLSYRPRSAPRLPSLDASGSDAGLAARVRALFRSGDRAGAFLRETLAPMLVYTARVAPDIASSIDDIDRVMRWGFGWELGPFELFDAIGVDAVVEAYNAWPQAERLPPLLDDVLASATRRFRDGRLPPASADLQILGSARERSAVMRSNAAASLVDLGDGVLCVEFHSKMNVIGGDTIEMLKAGVAEAERNFAALVVGSEAPNFSAGANLLLLLLEAQEANWDDIDRMIRSFQLATTGLRSAAVPVVVAPAGLALGGGCEVVLHGHRVQAAAETYLGLVEVGVGLVPAGAGTKEMLARAVESLPPGADLLPAAQRVFETIAFARVSTSGADARRAGYLAACDGVTMNRERLLHDAKQTALALARAGHQPPLARTAIRVGGDRVLAALKLGIHLAERAGRISEHDARVGRALARIIAGGDLPHPSVVSEAYLLDLEREAFLGLCGERKTLERIQYTLKTGKTLRN
jgi:3-hydroxyacyl-CoA dehydrogenase